MVVNELLGFLFYLFMCELVVVGSMFLWGIVFCYVLF